MQPIATDGVLWSDCVCLLAMSMSPAKTDELIEMSFGRVTWVGSRNHVFDRGSDPQRKGQFWGLSGPLKSIVSHCCSVCSKTINNGISTNALLPNGWCHFNRSAWKIRPSLQSGLSENFFDHLFIYWLSEWSAKFSLNLQKCSMWHGWCMPSTEFPLDT